MACYPNELNHENQQTQERKHYHKVLSETISCSFPFRKRSKLLWSVSMTRLPKEGRRYISTIAKSMLFVSSPS